MPIRSGAVPGAKQCSDCHSRGCQCSGEACQGQDVVCVECRPGWAGQSGGLPSCGQTHWGDTGQLGLESVETKPCAWAAKCMGRGNGSTGIESAFLGRQAWMSPSTHPWGREEGSRDQATWCPEGSGDGGGHSQGQWWGPEQQPQDRCTLGHLHVQGRGVQDAD